MALTRLKTVIVLFVLHGLASGCLAVAVVGGIGGYLVGAKDTIEGFSDQSYEKAWKAGQEVLKETGAVQSQNRETGKIEAKVKDSYVKFSLDQISPETVRVRVKLRKYYKAVPDVPLAKELYSKVMSRL